MMNNASLVCLSAPNKEYTGCETPEQLIAWVARVSNPTNQNNTATASKLVKYLIAHAHWSPFELAHMTVSITTTRDIAKQIVRHRSFSFQEFSQRYANPLDMLRGFVPREARLQDTKNRQASIELPSTEEAAQFILEWEKKQAAVYQAATDAYQWAIDNGIAKEQARCVLPEGNTATVIYMAGSVRSWIHYCILRRKWDTQKEHRLIADSCWELLTQNFPSVAAVIDKIEEDKKLRDEVYTIVAEHFNSNEPELSEHFTMDRLSTFFRDTE